jgi:N-acyl-D-aspartate/D-glutamate deacylase
VAVDLLLKDGLIVDGSGRPGFRGDVAVDKGKIAAVAEGLAPASARRVIAAGGLVVCPGFIDVHSHDDYYLLARPGAPAKLAQGVTTAVVGNCGFSVGPFSAAHRDEYLTATRIFGSGWVDEDLAGVNSLGDYLGLLTTQRPGLNVLSLVGHCTLRLAVMGLEERPPTPAELAEMKALTAQAMAEGAWGLSTGLIYAPGSYAATEELIELAQVAALRGGLYASHIRDEGENVLKALAEALEIGRRANLPVHVAHHKIASRSVWGLSRETLDLMDRARAEGLAVTCDQYPYQASYTYLAALLPPSVLAGGPEAFRPRLVDPAFREELRRTMSQGLADAPNIERGTGFEGLVLVNAPHHPEFIGRSLADLGQAGNKDPYDLLFDLVAEEAFEAGVILFSMGPEDVARIMSHPWTMVGSDGIPSLGESRVHPRFSGTFPRVLGLYVRDKGVLGLTEAVRKMTSLPAQAFGLRGKGLVQAGQDADLVLFDPVRIRDGATFEEPLAPPQGIEFVLVQGKMAVEEGRITGERAGVALRRGGS